MKTPRHPAAMLIGGALAGFLSGLMLPSPLGLRGAGFGCCLSLTVLLIRRFGWKRMYTYLPGVGLGFLLGFLPFEISFSDYPPPPTYDIATAINCALFIPLFAFAYLKDGWKKRLGWMMLFGLLSSLIRAWAIDEDWMSLAFVLYNFPMGMLPFLSLWLLAVRLTDPRLAPPPKTEARET